VWVVIGVTDVRPSDEAADAVLRDTSATLVEAIERRYRTVPTLELLEQRIIAPPHASFVAPPLDTAATLLRRTTLYRSGPRVVSRHLAYVDVSVLPSGQARLLREGATDLGALLRTNLSIHRTGFQFGDQDDLSGLSAELASCFRSGLGNAFGWRTYTAWVGVTAAFVVAEVVSHRYPSTA
jgi:hypothetical protein